VCRDRVLLTANGTAERACYYYRARLGGPSYSRIAGSSQLEGTPFEGFTFCVDAAVQRVEPALTMAS